MEKGLNTSLKNIIFKGEKMAEESQKNEYNFLVYKNETWGSYGQHIKIVKFIIDTDNKSQKPIWEIVNVKWENNDSRKNKHREAYAKEEDIMNLRGKILKEVYDHQSSRKREISVKYYYISDKLQEIQTETGVKVNGKYYDILTLEGKKILVNRDEVIVQ